LRVLSPKSCLVAAFALLAIIPGTGRAQAVPAGTPSQEAAPTPRGVQRAIDGMVFRMLQTMQVRDAASIAPLINALLGDTAAHMRAAPRRPATAADSARAREVVRTIREALAPYRDVAAAERAGYERFLPWLEPQAVYHYNNLANAAAEQDRFDPARPTSLLYTKGADGSLTLVGVMYTAPSDATLEELDARLPLGIAHWHQHVDFCGPRPGSPDARQVPDSAWLARWLAIDTRERCTAAGGIFLARLFGWMVHVNAFAGDTDGVVWGHEGRNHMHVHPAAP